jgi:serine phosphatase RsbU (regulator of sigma subunit)
VRNLLTAESAARLAGESAGRWWRELAERADAAMTRQALDGLFRDALATMRVAIGSDTISVLIANETGDALITRFSIGLPEEVSPRLSIRAGQGGLAGRVLASGERRIVPDLSQVELASPLLRESGVRSVVAVPIALGERRLGVLHAASYELDHFGPDSADLLDLLAQRLALAMDRVRLFEAERDARRQAEAATAEVQRLLDATVAFGSASEPDEVAEALLRLVDGPGLQRAWVGCWMRHGEALQLVGRAGELPDGSSVVDAGGDHPVARTWRASRHAPALAGRVGTGDEVDQDAPSPWIACPVGDVDVPAGVLIASLERSDAQAGDEAPPIRAAVSQAAQAFQRVALQTALTEKARTSAFLAEAAKAMSEASDFDEMLRRLAQLALPLLGDLCLIDMLGEDGNIDRRVALHRHPEHQPMVDLLGEAYPPRSGSGHPAAVVLRTGRTRWSSSMGDDFLRETTRDADHYRLAKALRLGSYISVPIVDTESRATVGAVTFVSTARPFTADDVGFAERLAEQVAAVVANARRHEATLRTARALQASLLPKLPPRVAGLDVHCTYTAATRDLDVGGDFYDMVTLPNGRVSFAVGDVEGHDRHAATLMGQLRSAVRALAGQVSQPALLIAALQRSWAMLGLDRMATALFGRVDPHSGDLVVASAGHPPPLLLDASGEPRFLPVAPSVPLGVAGASAAEWHGRLSHEQVLLLYTDGAVESSSRPIDVGMGLLEEAAAAGPIEPAAVCERVLGIIGTVRRDDAALLALRLAGGRDPAGTGAA